MKKTTSTFALIIFIFTLSSGISFCQDIDLSGTWVGETEVPDQGTDEMTLVLEKKDGEYTGTISDSLGMLQDVECEDIELKDNTLTLDFIFSDGYDYMTVYITLTVEGDTMTGYWETEDGSTGSIKLEKEE